MENKQNSYRNTFIILALALPLTVMLIIYLPRSHGSETPQWIRSLPMFNTFINATTAVLLVTGVYFVKRGKEAIHKKIMISAVVLGVVFLIFYVIYHSNVPATKFGGEGVVRNVYFFFLITHILLAFALAPLVLFTVYYALSQKLDKHRKLVKFTFPVWLYVSVTGVIVYLMISPYYSY